MGKITSLLVRHKKELSLLVLFLILLAPVVALAATTGEPAITKITLTDTIKKIVTAVLGIIGLIAVLYLIYGGVLYLTSGGNEEQVGKAKNVILYAIIGVIIIVLSYAIVSWVFTKFFGGEIKPSWTID